MVYKDRRLIIHMLIHSYWRTSKYIHLIWPFAEMIVQKQGEENSGFYENKHFSVEVGLSWTSTLI